MSRSALVDRLQARIGLDPDALGTAALDHAIDEACANLGCKDAMALLIEVERSPEKWQQFIDCMVIPETWFFRVPEQFAELRRYAQSRRPLRVLSLPSATGEEAYSIAIALFEAGLGPGEFDVLGIDVGARQIDQARRGRYRSYSFRGTTPAPEWFTQDGDEYLVVPAVKRRVRFQVGNILDSSVLGDERFDVIFFRNLLIYLDTGSRKRAVHRLQSVLTPGGLIFAGQAEVLSSVDDRLQLASEFGALTFSVAAQSGKIETAQLPSSRSPTRMRPAKALTQSGPDRLRRQEGLSAPDSLQLARKAADSGDLCAARNACQEALARNPESADTWFLLGVVETAAGELGRADEALLRATYLDRNHVDALAHRAALAARMGRTGEAAQLRARLGRLSGESV